jgi:ABC-type glycerol-3-phosphate transport system substrate-binding protein
MYAQPVEGDFVMERRDFLKATAATAAAAALAPSMLEARPAAAAADKSGKSTVTFWEFNTDPSQIAGW